MREIKKNNKEMKADYYYLLPSGGGFKLESSTKYESEEDIFWGFNIETELFGKHITGCEPKLFIKAQPYFDMFMMSSLKDEKTADLFKQMMLDTKDSKKITLEFKIK